MTSAANIAILSACAALAADGCASKRVLPDSSSVPKDELSATTQKSSQDDHWRQKRGIIDLEEDFPCDQTPSEPLPIEERIRMAKDMIKRKGDHFPEIIASDNHDTVLSIEALFSAMRGLISDPKRWFPQLGFSAKDQVLFLGTTSGLFLWVVAIGDDVSIGGRVFRKEPTIYLYETLIKAISRACIEPDGVLGSQRTAPDHQLATTIDFSCGPITLELYGARGSNKYFLDLIRSSDSPLRKSTNEQLPK